MKQKSKHFCVLAMAMTSIAAFADRTFTDSKWNTATDGNFFDTSKWDTGTVPTKSADLIVNGFLFNKASDYTVYLDKPTELNFLYIGENKGDNAAGAVTLVVTNDLLMTSVTNKWTGWSPDHGDTRAYVRRSLEVKGPRSKMIVKDDAELTIKPEILDNTWYNNAIVKVSDGAKLYVTNATLTLDTLRTSTYGNAHLHFDVIGTAAQTSVVEVVGGTVNYTGDDDVVSYGNPWKFKEYSRGIFTDTEMNIGSMWDLSVSDASKPVPEILLNGNTVFKWNKTSFGAIFNGGHVVFDDNACFTNVSAQSLRFYLGALSNGGSTHVELRGNSTFAAYGTVQNNYIRFGQENDVRDTTSRLTLDTTGEFRTWTGAQIGFKWGVGHLVIKKGTFRVGGWSDILLGTIDKNSAGQYVTGRVDVCGGVLSANSCSRQKVRGLVVGGAYNLYSADATDCYSYGEFNLTDGIVSNRTDMWVGVGLAKGMYRQTNGKYISDGHTVIGMAGGEGEMHILGGTYTIQDVWEASHIGTEEGHGCFMIGGASIGALEKMNRYAKITEDAANIPLSRPSKGYLCVSNATVFVGTYGANVCTDIGSFGTGLLELKNGAFYETSHMYMTNSANSVLKFTLSGETAPQLYVREQLNVGPGAKLVVDARGYKGEEKYIQLIKLRRTTYPNKYYQGWGFFRNGARPSDWTTSASVCDSFDTSSIETHGNVEIIQVIANSDGTGLTPGVWARITDGLVMVVR